MKRLNGHLYPMALNNHGAISNKLIKHSSEETSKINLAFSMKVHDPYC